MNVLIIGGASFLGLHLLEKLQESIPSANIYISSSRKEAINDKVVLVNYEIFESVLSLFKDIRPDYIIHLASCCVREPSFYSLNKGKLRDDHIVKALSRLEWSPRFIFIASMAVFSMSDKQIIPLRYQPESNYGLEKLNMINKLLSSAENNVKIRCKIVYPSSIYGKGQSGRMFLPRLLDHIEQKQLMVAFGGNKKRDFIHVEDVSRMLVELVLGFDSYLHQHIFLHSFTLYKISDVAALACKTRHLDPKEVIVFKDSDDEFGKDALEFQVVSKKDTFRYNFRTRISLIEGLQEMFEKA